MGMKYFSSISEIDVVFCRVAYPLEMLVCNPYSPFLFKTALHLVDFGHDCHYINFHKKENVQKSFHEREAMWIMKHER